MSFDKHMGKEHRKPFLSKHKRTKQKSIDCTCRNHGSCIRCENNRRINELKNIARTDSQLKEYKKGGEIR